MEDIRPLGAHYPVYLDTPVDFRTSVVDVNKLAECLPHGSGIDGDWTIRVRSNGDIIVYGEYNLMDENGYYQRWLYFRFTLARATRTEYRKLTGIMDGRYQTTRIKGTVYFQTFCGGGEASDYLYDRCYYSIHDAFGIDGVSSNTVPIDEVPIKYR